MTRKLFLNLVLGILFSGFLPKSETSVPEVKKAVKVVSYAFVFHVAIPDGKPIQSYRMKVHGMPAKVIS